MSKFRQIKKLRSVQLGPCEVIGEETNLGLKNGEKWIRLRIEEEGEGCEGIFADPDALEQMPEWSEELMADLGNVKKWWWILPAKDAEALVHLLSSFDSVSSVSKERLNEQGCDDLEEMEKRLKLADAKILELHREMAELRREQK